MKAIITPVGTSLFENLGKINENILDAYQKLKDLDREGESAEKHGRTVDKMKEEINKVYFNYNSSAEISSLIKIIEKYPNDEIIIYLLESDTILSPLASEVIKEKLPNIITSRDVKVERKKIQNLKINDINTFMRGMQSLIDQIYSIANKHYWSNIILNITGGYKATIPYLTILGVINNAEIVYMFEDMNSILNIPIIPISQDVLSDNSLVKFYDILADLSKGIDNEKKVREVKNSEFYKRYSIFVWEYENLLELNAIGKIYFENLKLRLILIRNEEINKIDNLNNDQKKILNAHLRRLKNLLISGANDPDLNHIIHNYKPPSGFRIYKGRTENHQVRILYSYNNNELKVASIVLRAHVNENDVHYVEIFRSVEQRINEEYKYYFI